MIGFIISFLARPITRAQRCHSEWYSAKNLGFIAYWARCFGVPQHDKLARFRLVDISHGAGISREGELLDLAIDRNLVQKSGTWFSYGEERIGQGRENARLWLKEHADATAELEKTVRESLGLTRGAAAETEPVQAEAKGDRRVRI